MFVKLIFVAALAAAIFFAALGLKDFTTKPSPLKLGQTTDGYIGIQAAQLKNPTGIGIYRFNEHCNAVAGTITVLATTGSQALVKYRSEEEAFGSECPSGAYFFIKQSQFRQLFSDNRQAAIDARTKSRKDAAEKAAIKQLLAQRS